jgi:hypothetical protein
LNNYKKLNIIVIRLYRTNSALKISFLKGVVKMDGFLGFYTDMSKAFRKFFSGNGLLKILLPLDVALIIIGVAVLLIGGFFGWFGALIGGGTIIGGLAVYLFIIGIVTAMANGHNQFVWMGLFGFGGISLLRIFRDLFNGGGFFAWGSIFTLAVTGGIAFLVMKYCQGAVIED